MASGTTPVKAWPYPLETDTPDVAADMHSLALGLDVVGKTSKGTLASKPSSGMTAGDRYLVTGDSIAANNGLEFAYDGSVWQAINQQRLLPIAALSNITAVSGQLINAGPSITVTLPAATAGSIVCIWPGFGVNGGAQVTVQRAGSATIYGPSFQGVTSVTLGAAFQPLTLVCDGTNWLTAVGVIDTGWMSVSYGSGMSGTVSARRINNMAYLAGQVSGPWTSGNDALSVPSLCIPNVNRSFGIVEWNVQGVYDGAWLADLMTVNSSTGVAHVLNVQSATSSFINLDGLSYAVA